jgi:transcription termination/antitermination protein NusA
MSILNMQTMRYINLLDKESRVKTTKCFSYNNMIIFAVPKAMVSKAIGPGASNVMRLQDKLGKRIRIIEEPTGIDSAQKFVESIVAPLQFNSLEFKEGVFILSAGSQSKAALIGRNKRRLDELNLILMDSFGHGLRIV